MQLPVTVTDAADRVHGYILFDTRDLSAGGAFVRSDLLFEIGEVLHLRVELPDGREVQTRGRVVRVVRDAQDEGTPPGMGIQFIDLPDDARTHLMTLTESK